MSATHKFQPTNSYSFYCYIFIYICYAPFLLIILAFAISRCRQWNVEHFGSLLLQTVSVPFHLHVRSHVLVQGQWQSLHFVFIVSPQSRIVPDDLDVIMMTV